MFSFIFLILKLSAYFAFYSLKIVSFCSWFSIFIFLSATFYMWLYLKELSS